MSWFRVAVWLVSSLATTQAHAFIDPPAISPENPTDTTPITISIRSGVCDALLSYEIVNDLDPVEIVIRRIRTQSDPFCNQPVVVAEIPIETLPVGTHEVRLMFVYNYPPDAVPFFWQELILDVSPTGPPGAAVPVPFIQNVWLLLILVALIVLSASRRSVWNALA